MHVNYLICLHCYHDRYRRVKSIAGLFYRKTCKLVFLIISLRLFGLTKNSRRNTNYKLLSVSNFSTIFKCISETKILKFDQDHIFFYTYVLLRNTFIKFTQISKFLQIFIFNNTTWDILSLTDDSRYKNRKILFQFIFSF